MLNLYHSILAPAVDLDTTGADLVVLVTLVSTGR